MGWNALNQPTDLNDNKQLKSSKLPTILLKNQLFGRFFLLLFRSVNSSALFNHL